MSFSSLVWPQKMMLQKTLATCILQHAEFAGLPFALFSPIRQSDRARFVENIEQPQKLRKRTEIARAGRGW